MSFFPDRYYRVQSGLADQACIFRVKQLIIHRGVFDDKKLGKTTLCSTRL